MVIDILTDGLFAAMAAIGFGAVSAPSRRSLPGIAMLAAIGHALRHVLMVYCAMDIVTSTMFASLLIGFSSLYFAKRAHTPLACMYIPALLPMVPGMYAYKAVFALIMTIHSLDNTTETERFLIEFMTNFTVTVLVLGVLAAGATVPNLIFRHLAFTMTRPSNGKNRCRL